ncbi:MAG: NAD/NADP octopine/nopaline dehydrogenase family protein [Natronincolaceae bacterium]|nr:NAD/NADP octopine/nopaline dehydrogenase family protein [Bacillota bacterium]NLK90456.1 NAD(P)-binding domain-containing protein [Clostridiales bacterium]
MERELTYCIIGAGNGGIAMAGYLAMVGYKVNLYNRTLARISPLMRERVIYLEGEEKGYGVLNKITNNIEEAIEDVDIIMVTVPAMGHYNIARSMAPYLRDNQIVILSPGRTGGALEVYEILLRERENNKIIVAEAQTFIYACRSTAFNQAHIFKSKKEVTLAAIPATETNYVLKLVNKVYPQFIPAKDVLETSINNYGAIFHPAPTLLNSGHIERCAPFEYYIEGITPSIGNFLEKLDKERMELGRMLQIKTLSAIEWLEETYAAKGKTIFEAVQNNPAYRGLQAPQGLDIRYIYEDVPYGLVPMESMANVLGIRTPAITSIIDIAQLMTNRNFREEGRTADRLGLEGLSVAEMHMLARRGTIVRKELEEVV